MGIGALNYQGVKGGIKLNDVIEEFKYAYKGQEIKAGDFVNYINGVAGQTTETSTDTQLSTDSYSGYTISAVKLDDNRIFIAHSRGGDYSLYGIVVTINGATITAGTDTKIDSSYKYTGYVISTQLLSDGNVFIANSRGGSHYLDCNLVSINGTTITYLKGKQLSTTSNSGSAISTQLLPNGKVFIAHSRDGNYSLYGMVVTINGTTITAGTDTQFTNVEYTGNTISTQLLSKGKVFIACSKTSSNLYLYGILVDIIESTINVDERIQLSNTSKTGRAISTVKLDNSRIFIVHSYNNIFQLYGMIVTIDGTSFTHGIDTQLSSTTNAGVEISTQLLPNGNVFIAHSYTTDFYLYGMIVTINGTTITHGTDTQLSSTTNAGDTISPQLLPNGNVFIAHHDNNNYSLYSQIFGIDEENNVPTNQIKVQTYEQQVTPSTQPPFDGIALSSGVGGDDTGHNEQVKIAKPNI